MQMRLLVAWLSYGVFLGSAGASLVRAQAPHTERVNVGVGGAWANDDSYSTDHCLSDDGLIVVFTSDATNLVPGDTNAKRDVFVRDIAAGTTTRISVNNSGVQLDGDCDNASVSGDGRYVAYESVATNLLGPGGRNIFLFDRQTGITSLVSVSVLFNGPRYADGPSRVPVLSADGSLVVFESDATNFLGSGDTNGVTDIYGRTRGSLAPAMLSQLLFSPAARFPSVSADGTRVLFATDKAFDPITLVGSSTLWVRDRSSGATTVADSFVVPYGNPHIVSTCISGDGSWYSYGVLDGYFSRARVGRIGGAGSVEISNVRFFALRTHGMSFDGGRLAWTEGTWQTPSEVRLWQAPFFVPRPVRDISVNNQGVFGDRNSIGGAVDRDGYRVVFASYATNLVTGDTNGKQDIFLRDWPGTAEYSYYGTPCAGTVAGCTTVPSSLSASYGNSSSLQVPLTGFRRQFQQVIPAADLPSDLVITGIALRLDENASGPGAVSAAFHITFALTTYDAATLTDNFATNANAGSLAGGITNGSIYLPPIAPPVDPLDFRVVIPFATPVSWHATPGVNLLLRIRTLGTASAYPLDAADGVNAATLEGDYLAATGQLQRGRGIAFCLLSASGAPPVLLNVNRPAAGTTFRIDVRQARAGTIGAMFFGESDRNWAGGRLPYSLAAFGAPQCNLLTPPTIALSLSTNAQGQSMTLVPIPNIEALWGSYFFNQACVVDPQANGFGLVFTQGGKGVIAGR